MLYDQAQLAVAYSYAYQSTKDKKYAAIVEDILTYVNRYVKNIAIWFYFRKIASFFTSGIWAIPWEAFLVPRTRTPNLSQHLITRRKALFVYGHMTNCKTYFKKRLLKVNQSYEHNFQHFLTNSKGKVFL